MHHRRDSGRARDDGFLVDVGGIVAGSFDFLHIKRRTAGSSNELSFDVLEHKSDEVAGRSSRGSKVPKAPKASQGTYHGVGASSTLTAQDEVNRRKKERHVRRIRLYVLMAVAAIALVAFGIYGAMSIYEVQKDTATRINELVDRLSEVDETLVEIDDMMVNPFDPDEAQRRQALLADMPKLTTELNRISVDAQTMLDLSLDEQAALTVGQLNTAAQARNGMLNAAAEAFELSQTASEQVARANSAWNDVLNADQQVRAAIAASNKATTQDATRQALDQLNEATDGFTWALSELRDISDSYGVDLSAQQAYLNKKIEAVGKAVETSEALLAGDRAWATEANDAYNAADAEAAKLAAELPSSVGDIVQAQFEVAMEEVQARYGASRDRTVTADSVIREYLG